MKELKMAKSKGGVEEYKKGMSGRKIKSGGAGKGKGFGKGSGPRGVPKK
jgi:hypothetical protein